MTAKLLCALGALDALGRIRMENETVVTASEIKEEAPRKKREPSVTWKMIRRLVDARKIVREPAQYPEFSSTPRQGERSELFRTCFRRTSEKFGSEPRKARRKIARALAKQLWREKKGLAVTNAAAK